jgi:hypothetical protein
MLWNFSHRRSAIGSREKTAAGDKHRNDHVNRPISGDLFRAPDTVGALTAYRQHLQLRITMLRRCSHSRNHGRHHGRHHRLNATLRWTVQLSRSCDGVASGFRPAMPRVYLD